MVSSASSKVSGARIDGSRLASIVLPEPGGPIIRMLWLPAAATSSARLAVCCPRTSLKSTAKCCSSPSSSSVDTRYGSRWNHAHQRAVQQLQHVQQRRDRVDVHALHHRSLGRVGRRQNQVGNPFFARQHGHGQHARHRTHAAVQPQFAHQQKAAQVAHLQRAVSAQDADGDGRSKPEPSFFRSAGARLMVMCVGGIR